MFSHVAPPPTLHGSVCPPRWLKNTSESFVDVGKPYTMFFSLSLALNKYYIQEALARHALKGFLWH